MIEDKSYHLVFDTKKAIFYTLYVAKMLCSRTASFYETRIFYDPPCSLNLATCNVEGERGTKIKTFNANSTRTSAIPVDMLREVMQNFSSFNCIKMHTF